MLVLEILKQEERLSMSLFEQEEATSTLRHYSQSLASFSQVQKVCQEIISILNKASRKAHPEPELTLGLQKSGQFLWDHLLSRSVKDRLRDASSRDLVLFIDEELISVPWELLFTGEDFLCLKFNLGRLVRTKDEASQIKYRHASPILKMLILADPTADLKSAYLEGLYIKNQFERKHKEIRIDFKSTYIDTLYVKKNLRDYDLVHFAGHCEYDSSAPENNGWLLRDGKFCTQDILALGESLALPHLVFSNACHSAKIGDEFMAGDYQQKTYSLAAAFLFSGVRHYIGTIWKIEDPVSLAFAHEFYTQLIQGESVGESLRQSRLRLIREYGFAHLGWGSHLLYGNPNFRLFRGNQAKALPIKPKSGVPLSKYKPLLARLFWVIAAVALGFYLYMWLPSINPNSYILFAKSRNLFQQGKNEETIKVSERILKNDPLFLGSYPLLAGAYQRLGDIENALKSYFEYARYAQKKNDKKSLSAAYIGIGWAAQLSGDYPRAFDYYNKALSLSKESRDRLNEAVALRKLAVWYMDKENNDKAMELLMKSSEMNREKQFLSEYRYNLACDYFDIGLVFANKDDFSSAKAFYQKSQVLFEKLKLKGELSDLYFNLGEIYFFEKQFDLALNCYFQGLKIDQAQANLPSIASDYNMIGELYTEIGNFKEAEGFFQQAISLCQKIKAPPELASAYYNLGLLYKKRGQKNKAREYLRLAQEIYCQIDTPSYQKIKQDFLELNQQ